ncbi:MAG: ABC transporter permease, partial [Chloroflexi bacterium]|nr:ABC transporter permease [Chloroflexota bacterium]
VVLGAMGLGVGAYVTFENDRGSYLSFIGPGIIGGYSMFAAFFECTYGSFTRMEIRRLYNAMIATPLMIDDVFLGEALWGATRALLSGTVVLIVIAALGFVDSPVALLVPVLVFVVGLLFASLGLLFTAFAPSYWTFNYAITLVVMPMYFLGGVFFPLDRYPEVVGRVAWALPLTPYVAIIRELVGGHVSWTSLWGFAYLLTLTAILYSIALFQMRRRLIR